MANVRDSLGRMTAAVAEMHKSVENHDSYVDGLRVSNREAGARVRTLTQVFRKRFPESGEVEQVCSAFDGLADDMAAHDAPTLPRLHAAAHTTDGNET
jgi:hypothetical protein